MIPEDFIELLDGVSGSPSGWNARCPAHEDRSASLRVSRSDDGLRILCHCHAGCDVESVVGSMGLKTSDLIVTNEPPTHLEEFASAKHLPVDYLRSAGVEDLPDGGISITYWNAQGQVVGKKIRRTLSVRSSRWPSGQKVIAFGLWALASFRQQRRLILVEGESDALTGWLYGLPVIGLPGAATVRATLTAELVEGIEIIDVVQEPDGGGAEFVSGVSKKLSDLGWKGTGRVVRFQEAKDLSDLHIKAGGNFPTAFESAIGLATPLPMLAPAPVEDGSSAGSAKFLEEWPLPQEIKSATGHATPRLSSGMLPASLGPWLRDEAERMGAPPEALSIFALAALGTVLGKKVAIRPRANDTWLVVANLWALNVAPPGGLKTPIMNAGLAPLMALVEKARKDAEARRPSQELQRTIQKVQRGKLEADIKRAIESGENPSRFVSQMEQLLVPPVGPRRYVTNDSTIESLGDLLRANPDGLMIVRDEMTGLFHQFERDGHEQDRAFLLEAWSGLGNFEFDRIGRGNVVIPSLRIAVAGTIQPEPFNQYVRAAVRGGAGSDGLIQRFQLLLLSEEHQAAGSVDRAPDEQAMRSAFAVYDRLDVLAAQQIGAFRDASLPYLRFSAGGQKVFNDWLGLFDGRIRRGGDHPALVAHLVKYRSLMPSLALLFHLADVVGGLIPIGPVSEGAANLATEWIGFLEAHARRIYGAVTNGTVSAERLADKIRSGALSSLFTERDVYRAHWAGLAKEDLEDALSQLEQKGWVRKVVTATAGRSKVTFHVNPRVFSGGGAA